MKRYFKNDELRISFTFQAKYLGMSPWDCPGIFSIISYIEHDGGIWHPIGGLNRISESMAKIIKGKHNCPINSRFVHFNQKFVNGDSTPVGIQHPQMIMEIDNQLCPILVVSI